MDELVYWIWLSLACSVGGSTFSSLMEKYGSAKAIYEADPEDLYKLVGYRNSDRGKLADKSLDKALEIYDFCKKYKVGILAYSDERYPQKLRDISSPPVLLYYRGVLPDFNSAFSVACVGTRALSDYGRKSALKICYDLSLSGATVISGMASGIDGVSHAAALHTGGITVAVLGSGIDVCYPQQHRHLAREIVKKGCVLTEYPPKTPPNRYNFPKRNRIISGLADATLVIEGKEKSGAYITASYAKEQGRLVYALPGNVGSSNSELSNLLIKNGAKLCTCADDIVRDFMDKYPGVINPFNLPKISKIDYLAVLSEYKVVAVCPSDDIFIPSYNQPIKVATKKPDIVHNKKNESDFPENEQKSIDPPEGFDINALRIYKLIPQERDIDVESLTSDEMSLRTVMSALLKLEMGGFIKMLPSGRVARK